MALLRLPRPGYQYDNKYFCEYEVDGSVILPQTCPQRVQITLEDGDRISRTIHDNTDGLYYVALGLDRQCYVARVVHENSAHDHNGYWTLATDNTYWSEPMVLEFRKGADEAVMLEDTTAVWCPRSLSVNFVDGFGKVLWNIHGMHPVLPEQAMSGVGPGSMWDWIDNESPMIPNQYDVGRRERRFYDQYVTATHAKMRYRPIVEEEQHGRLFMTRERVEYEFPEDLFVGNLLRIGLTEDCSSLRNFAYYWEASAPHSFEVSRDNKEWMVPWSRVYVHRGQDAWRFLFVVKGAIRKPNAMGHGINMQRNTHPIMHLLPIVVDHSETLPMQKTWRGLPLPLQQAIWSCPGMSSALSHALIMLKNRVRTLDAHSPFEGLPNMRVGHSMVFCIPGSKWGYSSSYSNRGRSLENFVADMQERIGPNTLVRGVKRVAPVQKTSKRDIEI